MFTNVTIYFKTAIYATLRAKFNLANTVTDTLKLDLK